MNWARNENGFYPTAEEHQEAEGIPLSELTVAMGAPPTAARRGDEAILRWVRSILVFAEPVIFGRQAHVRYNVLRFICHRSGVKTMLLFQESLNNQAVAHYFSTHSDLRQLHPFLDIGWGSNTNGVIKIHISHFAPVLSSDAVANPFA